MLDHKLGEVILHVPEANDHLWVSLDQLPEFGIVALRINFLADQ